MISLEKDELYYDDLMYVVKKYVGLISSNDTSIENRIMDRCKSVDVVENGVRGSIFSEFQLEVFSVLDDVMQEKRTMQAGFMLSPSYQELVSNALNKIEIKKMNVKK